MSEVMSEEVKPVDQPRSWFGYDSVLYPLFTCAYVAAVIELSDEILIANRTPITVLCLSVALFAPMILPFAHSTQEVWAIWKNRKAGSANNNDKTV